MKFLRISQVLPLFTRQVSKKYQVKCFSQANGVDQRTALYNFHVSRGGKMVPFAGWSMPVQYGNHTIVDSVTHTRQKSSIFDVSHMLQMEVCGKDAQSFLEYILVADVANLGHGSGCLSVFTTINGGIIDDCIVTRTGQDSFYIVANAGRADVDLNHIREQLQLFRGGAAEVVVTPLKDRSLIALQGPASPSILQSGVSVDLSSLKFMNSQVMSAFGISDCRITRCGYTGEDGFEVSVPTPEVVTLTEKLLSVQDGAVKMAGLGARDVLRLEAGLCLYGNDISEETTPIEAGLTWCISKRRRAEGGFLGSEVILTQLKEKPSRKRVGLITEGGAPARSGYAVLDMGGNSIGSLTSGSPSPSLKANIAMAYVPSTFSKIGTKLQIQIRKKAVNAKIVKMPFIPSNYFH